MFLKRAAVMIISVYFMVSIDCKPFLYNAPRAIVTLASSASASASQPSEPSSNIADLTKRSEKSEKLQSEKYLISEDESLINQNAENDENNEASPSLIQKKVNKIFNKLRFISGISSALGSEPTAEEVSKKKDDDFDKELAEFDKEFQNDVAKIEEEEGGNGKKQKATFEKVVYPHSVHKTPYKVSLNVRDKIVSENSTELVDTTEKQEEAQEEEKENEEDDYETEESGKFGQIGVFFAELLGSLVGLAYGAAASISNVAQGNTNSSAL